MPQIRLTGHIDVAPEQRDGIVAALQEHIRLTSREPGCLSFDVTPDVRVPGRWQVTELFASRADFDAHQLRAAASVWGSLSQGIERQYRLEEIDR